MTDMGERKEKPLFIVVEGIDGTGKSTLAMNLCKALKERGVDTLCTFEPTDGRWGRMLRASFTGRNRLSLNRELELFLKDRREHLENGVNPALESGRTVVCDRYYFSTMAYQGARGMDMHEIRRRNESFAPIPDLVLLLELSPEEAVRRITGNRGETLNNFEKEDYLKKVAANFDKMHDDCIRRIDAAMSPDEVLKAAIKYLEPMLFPLIFML